MVLAGFGGYALLMVVPTLPAAILEPIAATIDPPHLDTARRGREASGASAGAAITRLAIPSINLDTAVVVARLVEHDGLSTWDVPNFVAGHAEGTAGAGQAGNAVVVGHVISLTHGKVFEHLDRVGPGDRVEVWDGEHQFAYRVVGTQAVARTDVSVLDADARAGLTLITCAGAWLPTVWDYSERLVVRAELDETTGPSARSRS